MAVDAAVKHVDKKVETVAEKHSDRTIKAGGITFSFYWDPFLNGTRAGQLLDGTFSAKTGGQPTLAVIGSGIWYLRHPESGGISAWNRKMDAIFAAANPSLAPIADELILLPVENAIESRLSPERAATVHLDDIRIMNEGLDDRIRSAASKASGSVSKRQRPVLAIPRAFNKLIAGLEDETVDGLHFSDSISKVQASILLNLRCNDVLPKKFPFDKTCCFQYPSPNYVQMGLLAILLAWAPAGLYLYSRCRFSSFNYRESYAHATSSYSGSCTFPLQLLPRPEIPPPPRYFQFRRLLPLRRRSNQSLPEGEQAI